MKTGDLAADILSNIAAEQRAKVVYEYLHRQINDKGVRATIDFLLNREEAHNTMSGKPSKNPGYRFSDGLGHHKGFKAYFNLSTPGDQYFSADNRSRPDLKTPTPAATKHPFLRRHLNLKRLAPMEAFA
jgi:Mn-containing catalase